MSASGGNVSNAHLLKKECVVSIVVDCSVIFVQMELV